MNDESEMNIAEDEEDEEDDDEDDDEDEEEDENSDDENWNDEDLDGENLDEDAGVADGEFEEEVVAAGQVGHATQFLHVNDNCALTFANRNSMIKHVQDDHHLAIPGGCS